VRALAITAVVLALAGATPAMGGTTGWRQYQEHGFSLSLPSSWRLVPATRAKTTALATRLRADGQTKLAITYDSIANDAFQWQPPPRMHAFQWPVPPTAVSTDMLVRSYPGAGSASLGTLAHVLASELAKQQGVKLTAPLHMSGTAEDCYRIEVRAKLDKTYGAQASYTLVYLLLHSRTLYNVSVRGEAGLGASYRPLANRIAESFHFN
jgi:hypothetical protein